MYHYFIYYEYSYKIWKSRNVLNTKYKIMYHSYAST